MLGAQLPATCELVALLLPELGVPIDAELATVLMTGVCLVSGILLVGQNWQLSLVVLILLPLLFVDFRLVAPRAEHASFQRQRDAAEVLMVAEIVGPEHGAVDRTFKPLVYARARLPYLLLVDRHAPFASASMLIGGRFHEYARTSGPEELELEEPFRLRLPLPES